MKSDTDIIRKHSFAHMSKICGIVALLVLLLCILIIVFGPPKFMDEKKLKPSPPDLSRCTRIEIKYSPSLIKNLIPPMGFDPGFLNSAETEYLQSLEKIVIDDKKTIKILAHQIGSGIYKRIPEVTFPARYICRVRCYQNEKLLVFITRYGPNYIVTENNQSFVYDNDLPKLIMNGPLQLRPLALRSHCGCNLWHLWEDFFCFSGFTKAYPLPINWCEMIMRNIRKIEISEEKIKQLLICPGAGEGKSHYAMNPNCKPDSSADMVLLFETKAGWNQHGGLELFTFDNHDPKGGCVLLNDGTVKFIRTKEELNQLRWK